MNTPCTVLVCDRQATRVRSTGFTLVELLVVLAIIAMLAAILLPVLSKAKASGQSAACKSNLRQTGSALAMFVNDAGSYPQLAMAGIKNGKLELIGGGILVGALTNDPVYGAFLEYIPSGTGKIFLCPAKRLSSNDVPARIDYGYNAIGAAWHGNDRLALGLAPAQIWTNSSSFGSLGQIDRVYESMVANPSDMIALGDSSSTVPDPYHPVPDVIDPYVEEYKIFAPLALSPFTTIPSACAPAPPAPPQTTVSSKVSCSPLVNMESGS